MVDEAYWQHTLTPSREIGRLDQAVVDIPYPWVDGDPLEISIVSSTGVTFTYEVAVATQSPEVSRRYVMTFALLGVYVGVIPVSWDSCGCRSSRGSAGGGSTSS